MRVIHGTTDADRTAVFAWLDSRVPGGFGPMPNDFRAIYQLEVADDGTSECLSVVAFTNWTPFTAVMHIASDLTHRWATAKFIYECYHYAFDLCGLTRLNAIAHGDNPESIKLHERLGHHRDCELRHYDGPNKHAYLYSMTFEDWKTSKWNKASA